MTNHEWKLTLFPIASVMLCSSLNTARAPLSIGATLVNLGHVTLCEYIKQNNGLLQAFLAVFLGRQFEKICFFFVFFLEDR